MHLKTLGGLELVGEGGARLERPKPLLLLAYLAVEGAKDRHHLAELFWPEASRPLNSLRVALAQVRSAAPGCLVDGPMVANAPTLTTRATCDAVELLKALDRGEAARAAALYEGPFLAGFYLKEMSAELEDWVYATRQHLAHRVQLRSVEEAERLAAGGAFAEAGRLAARAHAYTADAEPDLLLRLHRLLVAGHHDRAAETAALGRELGVVLDDDTDAARAALTGPARTTVSTTLPAPLTPLVGRDLEVVTLGNLLATGTRLVSIVGVGGVGKSRLALEVAAAAARDATFEDGVHLVELGPLTDHRLVLDAVAAAVGAPEGAGARERLDAAFDGRRVLLVLDDFEHVIEAATELPPLLRRHPGLAVLVTSRRPLDLTGEQVFRHEALSLPGPGSPDPEASDAVRLFRTLAKRADVAFEVDASNVRRVVAVCEAVHGLPLGIELAAGALTRSRLEDVAEALAREPRSLTSTKRDTAPRHGSLRATIEHSWSLLSGAEDRVLVRLAVFRGGFTRAAAAEVAGATLATLGSLTAKALLREQAPGRYDAHPLVRDHARELLEADPDRHRETLRAHAEHHARWACSAEEPLKGGEQAAWLERLDEDLGNLRLALSTLLEAAARGDGEAARLALSASGALWQFWLRRGRFAEGRRWCEAAVEVAPEEGMETERAKALSGAGVMAFYQRDLEAARRHHTEALRTRRQTSDRLGQARSLYNLASIAGVEGDLDAVEVYLGEAIAAFREGGDRWSLAFALNNLALLAANRGRVEEARAHFEERLRLQREIGDVAGEAETMRGLGNVHFRRGDLEASSDAYERALELAVRVGDVNEVAGALGDLAVVRHHQGRHRESARLLGGVRALREAHELPPLESVEQLVTLSEGLRDRLGAAFEAELRRGAELSLEGAVEAALGSKPAGTASAQAD